MGSQQLSRLTLWVFRAAVLLHLVFTVVYFVGYCSLEWYTIGNTVHYGLWQVCDSDSHIGCTHLDNVLSPEGGYKLNSLAFVLAEKGYVLHHIGHIRTARAFCILGLIDVLMAAFLGCYYASRCPGQKSVLVASCLILLGGVLCCVGAVVYLGTKPEGVAVDWGVVVTIAGAAGLLVAGLLSTLLVTCGMILPD